MEEMRDSLPDELLVQTVVNNGDEDHILDVRNISVNGIFITTDDVEQTYDLHVDQLVGMDIFSFENPQNVDIDGRVVRIQKSGEKYGVGIRFEDVTEDKREQIAELVQTVFKLYGTPPMLPNQLLS